HADRKHEREACDARWDLPTAGADHAPDVRAVPDAVGRREVVAPGVADEAQAGRLVDAEVDRVVPGEELALEFRMAEGDAGVDEPDRDRFVARLEAVCLRRVDPLVR